MIRFRSSLIPLRFNSQFCCNLIALTSVVRKFTIYEAKELTPDDLHLGVKVS